MNGKFYKFQKIHGSKEAESLGKTTQNSDFAQFDKYQTQNGQFQQTAILV